jgi:small conductance mechanosensitive channel
MEKVYDRLYELLGDFILLLPKLAVSLVVFLLSLVVAGFFSRAVRRAMERREANTEITLLISKLVRWGTIVLSLIVALQQINFNVTAFLTGLGVVGFTIGFALQDVSKNFVAGVLLLLERPFDIGDAITVKDFSGTVVTVELRATALRTFDGKDVLIPNADVFANPIVNYGRASQRRINLVAGVAYESDLESVRQTALEALASIEGVLQDPAPRVAFDSFGPSSVDFTAYYWVDTQQIGVLDGRDAGIRNLKTFFDRAGIEMPYPTQVVLLEQAPPRSD